MLKSYKKTKIKTNNYKSFLILLKDIVYLH